MADTTKTPPVRVLISYRREDTAGHAGRVYDALIDHFGREQVFMDIDAIEPGVDFSEVIAQEVSSCDVLLAVIGRRWLSITDAKGRRRLDNPEDFHRLEIQEALQRNIRVIPVLVQDADMPSVEDLPESIGRLGLRNALDMSDNRWRYDVGRLISAIEGVARTKGAGSLPPSPPSDRPGPRSAGASPARAGSSSSSLEPRAEARCGRWDRRGDGRWPDRGFDRGWRPQSGRPHLESLAGIDHCVPVGEPEPIHHPEPDPQPVALAVCVRGAA